MKLILLFFIIPFTCFGQSRWHPFAGLHGSMDGEGIYAGLSYQAGIDYNLKPKTTLGAYIHYFPKNLDYNYNDGSFEKGKYRSAIYAALIQRQLSKKVRGCYIGGGIAVQHTSEDYESDFEKFYNSRIIIVACFRFGYSFQIRNQMICFELNATGPHSSNIDAPAYDNEKIELLTQLSGGLRFIF